jgi:hypothetical protein
MHYNLITRCWPFELVFKKVTDISNKFTTCLTHTQFAIARIIVTDKLKSSLIISLYLDLSAWRV